MTEIGLTTKNMAKVQKLGNMALSNMKEIFSMVKRREEVNSGMKEAHTKVNLLPDNSTEKASITLLTLERYMMVILLIINQKDMES